jgi:hypothetical protein
MLWLGAFFALDLATSTPDAMCPPLDEARALVRARVGEVEGDYHAEFELLRGDDGGQALRLVLREGDREVLRRELSLDATGCRDAAQAIALVLERYFDAIEPPSVGPAVSAVVAAPDGPLTLPRTEMPTQAAPWKDSATSFRLHTGFAQDYALGVAASLGMVVYPSAWRFTSGWGLGVGLELTPFFTRQTQLVREQEVSAFSLQVATSAPVTWSANRWALAIGPWAQLRLQRAEGSTLASERPAYRALPGVGGVLRLAYWTGARWAVVVGGAAGLQLVGIAPRFALHRDLGPEEVLAAGRFFALGSLGLELRL